MSPQQLLVQTACDQTCALAVTKLPSTAAHSLPMLMGRLLQAQQLTALLLSKQPMYAQHLPQF
jgi:hypothetical protein